VRPPPAAGTLERLIFLSDGVFAIAVTLLVVALVPPSPDAPDFGGRLWDMVPKFRSYIISFAVIAVFWLGHVRVYRYIIRTDGVLVWISLGFLMCIAFQPFTTAVLGEGGGTSAAVVLYAGTLVITGILQVAIWQYAARGRRLVTADLSDRAVARASWSAASAPIIFAISIVIAQFNPLAAELSWLLILVVLGVLRRIYRDTDKPTR
jgi:uncharacterized membrane protein